MQIVIIATIIVIVACLGGVWFVKRHVDVQQTQVKAVLFGLYFWALVFLQVIIWGLSYYFK
ncbi:MAG: hypothetical protein ABL925_21050 [Methylococcales bacterium]